MADYVNLGLAASQVQAALLENAQRVRAIADALQEYNTSLDASVLKVAFPWDPNTLLRHGSCWVANRHQGLALLYPDEIFTTFQYFSGDMRYPVRHHKEPDPKKAFINGELWIGEYGKRRIMLLRDMADHSAHCATLKPQAPIQKEKLT